MDKGSGRGQSAHDASGNGLIALSPACPFLHSSRNFLRALPCSPFRVGFLGNIPTSGRIAGVSRRPRLGRNPKARRPREQATAGVGACAKSDARQHRRGESECHHFSNVFIVLTFAIFIALSLSSDRELTPTNFASGLFERRRTIARMKRRLGKEISPTDVGRGI